MNWRNNHLFLSIFSQWQCAAGSTLQLFCHRSVIMYSVNYKNKNLSEDTYGHRYNWQRIVFVLKYQFKIFKNLKMQRIIKAAIYQYRIPHGEVLIYGSLLISFLPNNKQVVKMGKFSMIMFSGTADKFIPLGVLADAAAAMGYEVNIFVTGFALLGFTKEKHEIPFPREFEQMAPMLEQGMKATNTKSWHEMISESKEAGNVKVYVCSLMASMFGLKKEDLDPIVDDIVGAATFLQMAEGGQVIFI